MKIKLIDNRFNKSEARFLINQLLDEKINFHKLHRLQVWEGNHKADTSYDDNRIEELQKSKSTLKELLDSFGDNVDIECSIKIR